MKNIPKHVAVIPDGNRRWAKAHKLTALEGHRMGHARFKELAKYARASGVEYLTIWPFSSENWNREHEEVVGLMELIEFALAELDHEKALEKARFVHIGNRDRLSKDVLRRIDSLVADTKHYTGFTLCVAINYGGADEVARATSRFQASARPNGSVLDYLDTALSGIPNPDLVIRTSGERRLSGFLPLQTAYSELYFDRVMFPDFTTERFQMALNSYARRKRRYGR